MALGAIENDILTWKNPSYSGAIFGIVNFIFVCMFFEVPLFAYFLAYGGILALVAGLLMKLTGKADADSFTLSTLVSLDDFKSGMEGVYTFIDGILRGFAPIIFWKDVTMSCIALFAIYFISSFLEILSVELTVFLIFNGLFAYGKFQEQIRPVLNPQIEQGIEACKKYFNMIPKYESPVKAPKAE